MGKYKMTVLKHEERNACSQCVILKAGMMMMPFAENNDVFTNQLIANYMLTRSINE